MLTLYLTKQILKMRKKNSSTKSKSIRRKYTKHGDMCLVKSKGKWMRGKVVEVVSGG